MSEFDDNAKEETRHAGTFLLDELDEIRAELSHALLDYERKLKKLCGTMPHWLAIEPEQLESLFAIEIESESAKIGPRTYAYAASWVETFVIDWLENDGIWKTPDKYTEACAAIERRIGTCETAVRARVSQTDLTLSGWLEGILAELEAEREHEEQSFSEKLNTGEITQGEERRQALAQLWEEQRKRSESVRKIWEPLEHHVFDGLDAAVLGLNYLRDVLARADSAIRTYHPQFDLTASVVERTEVSEAERQTIELERDSESEIDEVAGDGATQDPVSEEIGVEQSEPENTAPRSDDAQLSLDTVIPSADKHGSEAAPNNERTSPPADEVEEESGNAQSTPIDETDDTSQPDVDDIADTVIDTSDGVSDDTAGDEDEAVSTTDDPNEKRERIATFERDRETDTEDNPEPDEAVLVGKKRKQTGEKFTASRDLVVWDPISRIELYAFIIPVLVLLALMAVTGAHLAGLSVSNPFDQLPWLIWFVTIVVLIVTFFPMLSGWRVAWTGFVPTFICKRISDESIVLRVNKTLMTINDKRVRTVNQLLRVKWETPGTTEFGWCTRIEADNVLYTFRAIEADRTTWERSTNRIEDLDATAWEISLDGWNALDAYLANTAA